MNIEIKSANNINKLAQLASEIWHEYWTCILSSAQIDYMVENFQSEQAIIEQIKNENYEYFYILADENIVGYTGLSRKKEHLFLSKLYLIKEYRHKSIGKKVFEFIKEYAIKNNYKNIILTVNKNNLNTINTYKKWGFETIKSVITDIGNGFVMDDFIMQYTIKDNFALYYKLSATNVPVNIFEL